MSEEQKPDLKATLETSKQIQELFGVAHDLISAASHPGHMGQKVAEVLAFLKFQYSDFKSRVERLTKQLEQEAKAELSKVDAEAAKAATDAVLSAPEAPKS
jgi:uncharacterized protein with PIN domain